MQFTFEHGFQIIVLLGNLVAVLYTRGVSREIAHVRELVTQRVDFLEERLTEALEIVDRISLRK